MSSDAKMQDNKDNLLSGHKKKKKKKGIWVFEEEGEYPVHEEYTQEKPVKK
ncbi:MAG: hypothetical protein ABIH82_05310 [Candidatus Woesearchaeota archaeon]